MSRPDNVRDLRPGARTDLDAELAAAVAAEVGALMATRDDVLAHTYREPATVLVTPDSPVAVAGITELLGIPVVTLDALPGDAVILLAYSTADPADPPRKAHG